MTNITRKDITIGTWKDVTTGATYRAAYVGDCVLTGPEHADLPEYELLAEGVAEARRAEIMQTDERISAMVQAVSRVADVHVVDGRGRITNYTPDPAEYDGSTEPGSAWDEACDRLLAEVRAVLPSGWQAEWSDDDILIEDVRGDSE